MSSRINRNKSMKNRKTSIKTRVSLYYSFSLIIISLILTGAILVALMFHIQSTSHDTVMKAAQNAFDEITIKDNYVEIDSDFDSYKKGVSLLVYSEDGILIKGSTPKDFPYYTPLINGEFREISADDVDYSVYDLFTGTKDSGVWVRALYAKDESVASMKKMLILLLLALPLLLIVSISLGRRITTKALNPVTEIVNAANSISNGNDLSQRLPAGEGKDELYMLSRTLNEMIERLELAFNSEKQFSSDVSHELKTPVSVILAKCEYTLKEKRDSEEYIETIETIQKQCGIMISLIQQLLQLSKRTSGQYPLEKETFDLSMLCKSIADETESLSDKDNISIIRNIPENILFTGDESMILRMIMNLTTNAIKYSKKNAENKYIKISLLENEENISIQVEDNGIGIEDKDLPYIFNRLYKADKSRSETDSFGLGLSMVKHIAEAHNGTVYVASQIDVGSTFTVTLPKENK